MDLFNYLVFAQKTAVYPKIGYNWQYPLIGLTGELGELANILKKAIRDDGGIISQDRKEKCLDELGDIFWYLTMLCFELNINPNAVLDHNVEKLRKRLESNTVHDPGNRKEGT